MQMRDALGPLYTNAQFAPLFSHTGQPAKDPARLALVLVMQFTEGLSGRQAADAVRGRIDWAAHTATCPQGKQSTKWHPDRDRMGQEVIQIRFAQKDCQACAVRSACTRAKTQPRTLAVRPPLYHEALQSMRKRQATAEFQEQYAARAGIEGTLSQGVRAFGMRRSRYIGLAKTHLQHVLITTAINVVRVVAWLTEPCPTKPRASPFAA